MASGGTLYVTYVDIDRNLLKIWGQRDKNNAKFIDRYLQQLSSKLSKIASPESCRVQKGMPCFAQYSNGYYYRARTVSNLQNERVWVFFIDYGNTECVHISSIKILEVDENLKKICGQAEEFYLAGVVAPAGGWTDEIINKIRSDICNNEFCFTVIAQPADQKILQLKFGNEDFSSLLLRQEKVQPITIQEQTQMILSYCSLVTHDMKQKLPMDMLKSNFLHTLPHLGRAISSKSSQQGHLSKKPPSQYNYGKSNIPLNYSYCSPAQYLNSGQTDQTFLASDKIDSNGSQYYSNIEKVPHSDNIAQPCNPENETMFYNHPHSINQINNKSEQLLNIPNNVIIEVLTQQLKQRIGKGGSKADLMYDTPHNYVNSVFEVGSTHNIVVSHIDDGPWCFSVQMVSSENELNKLMDDLTMIELIPIKPPLVLGHPCIGASQVYKNLCRGVIVGISHSAIKVYFVDFGNTEDLPMSAIFELPHTFFSTKVLSQKFCLSGLLNVSYSNQIKVYFKEVVSDELLMLRVTSLEGDNLPTCDLYLKNKNIKRILNDKILNSKNSIDGNFKPGDVENVVVTWIENPQRFYVQLKRRDCQLNELKEELSHIESKSRALNFKELAVGLKCICKYSSDGQWYRVVITSFTSEDNVSVFYVDYGNSEIVHISSLRKIEGNVLINQMSNQAIECCLQGYENKFFDQNLIKELELLILDKDLKLIVSSVDNGKLFVHLYDNEVDIKDLLSKSNEKIGKFKADVSAPTSLTNSELSHSQIKSSEYKQSDIRNKFEKKEKSLGSTEFIVRLENRNLKYNRSEDGRNNSNALREQQNYGSFSYRTKSNKGFNQERSNQEKFIYGDKLIHNENFKNKKTKPNGDKRNKDFNGRRYKNEAKQENKFEENRKTFTECKESRNIYEKSSPGDGLRKSKIKSQRNKDFSNNVDATSKCMDDCCLITPDDVAPPGSKYKARTIDIGANEKSIITYYVNPYEFYVQVLTEEEDFKKMMKEIQSYYFSLNCVQGPVKKGDVVIAQFSHDKILYRAEVEKVVPLTVRYVDYGNQEEVELNQIWPIAKQFLNLPIQVVKCRLANIQPNEALWPLQSCQIENFFESEEYICNFLGCADEVYEVELKVLESGQNVADEIIAAGYGKPTIPKLDIAEHDFSLLPSQILRLFVSHVENSSKFYVILSPEFNKRIAEEIATYVKDKKNLRPIEEPVLPNTFCLATTDDILWFRGIIVSKDSDDISVRLLDRGDTITLTSEQVKILPEYLKCVPFQAVECFLREGESVSVENLKNIIAFKHLMVSITSISDKSRLSVVLYDENGSILDFQNGNGSPEFIVPIGQLPITIKEMQVKISHFESPKEIYIQRACDREKVNTLSDDLAEFYKNEANLIYEKKENLVAAKSVVYDKWFRGLVINDDNDDNDDTAIIFFIDFGYQEKLPYENLKKLHPIFYNVSALAKKISLNLNGNLNYNEYSIGVFEELLKGKNFLGSFNNQNGEFICDFFHDDISIFSQFSSPASLSNKKVDDSLKISAGEKLLENAEVNSILKVFVRHIETPKKFWVNKESTIKDLQNFQYKLQIACENLPDTQNFQIFDKLAAFYMESWYRAEILSIDEKIVSIKFIDIGKIWTTDLCFLKVKALSQEFLTPPMFSTCYSLKGNWEDNAVAIFKEIILKIKNPVDLRILEEGSPTVVDLFKDGLSISTYLKEESLKRSKEQKDDDLFTVYITHINSPDDFYIQRETVTNIIENMYNKLLEATSGDFEDLSSIQENKIYMAQFPDDENWYRAKVLKKKEEKLEVIFVDYGNVSVVSEIKVLPPEIAEIPFLGENYSLILGNECDIWSESACAKFAEYSDGRSLKMQIVTCRAEKPIVKLFCDGKNISEELASLCENDGRSEVCISHVNCHSDFFIQYLNDISFDFIREVVKNKVDLENLEDFSPETLCLALCSKDLLWYRGKILENLDDGYEVSFIDYGNTGMSTELKKLPEELQKIPPRALKCKLNVGENNLPEIVRERFIGLVCGGETVFRSRIILPGEINLISLKLNGEILEDSFLVDVGSDDKMSEYSSPNYQYTPNSSCDERNDEKDLNQANPNKNDHCENFVHDEEIENEIEEEKTVNIKINSSYPVFKSFKSDEENEIPDVLTNDVNTSDFTQSCSNNGTLNEKSTEINIVSPVNLEEISESKIVNDNAEPIENSLISTKKLLHSEKVVPGSISRGILEETPSEQSPPENFHDGNIEDSSSPSVAALFSTDSATSV